MCDTSTPIHDFSHSLKVARTDADLTGQLVKHLGTDELLEVNSSDLVRTTCSVVNSSLEHARALYAKKPERLLSVISASPTPNAYAIWSSTNSDWIVLTNGLLADLHKAAEELEHRFEVCVPKILQSAVNQRVLSAQSLPSGFKSSLSYLLYIAGISFFVGHEAGHHLAGHDGHYIDGSHAEAFTDLSTAICSNSLTAQALEVDADRYATHISRLVLVRELIGLMDASYSEYDRKQFHLLLALLISAGALVALVVLRPRAVDWSQIGRKTHPPTVVRAILIAVEISRALKSYCGSLTERDRKRIRLISLELVAQGTITKHSNLYTDFQKRKRRGEAAALRSVGIRAALYDPRLNFYVNAIKQNFDAVRPRLRPRNKE